VSVENEEKKNIKDKHILTKKYRTPKEKMDRQLHPEDLGQTIEPNVA
jgi:hypothetical protein